MAAKNGKKDESKADRFSRVASARTSKAIRSIRGVANTAGKTYEYTDDQAAKIVQALADEVKRVQAAFAGKVTTSDEFTV